MTMREPPSGNVGSSTPGQPTSPSTSSSNMGGTASGRPSTPPGAQPQTGAPQQNQGGVSGVKDQIGEQVGPAVDQVQDKAGQAFSQVREQVTTRLDSQKDKAAEGLTQAAEAVRKTGEQLRQQEQVGVVANYTDDAAETIERLANFLRERDVAQIMGDAERFARQRPTMFLASAFTLGLAAARFLKSSPSSQGNGNGMSYGYGQAPRQLSSPSYTPTPMRQAEPPTSVRTSTPSTTPSTGASAGGMGTGTSGTTAPRPPSTPSTPNAGPSSPPPNRGS